MGWQLKDVWRVTPVGAVVTVGQVISGSGNPVTGYGQSKPTEVEKKEPERVDTVVKTRDYPLYIAIGVGIVALVILGIQLTKK